MTTGRTLRAPTITARELKRALACVLTLAAALACSGGAACQSVRIAAVGDVMLARGVERECRRHGWDYPFTGITGYLHRADVAFCNLECPVSRRGAATNKAVALRADPACLPALRRAGFTAASVANNHTMDYGTAAFADTLAGLRGQGIMPVGGGDTLRQAQDGAIVETRGVRIGLLGYSQFAQDAGKSGPSGPAMAAVSQEKLTQMVRSLRSRCSYVIVSCHWGIEGERSHDAAQSKLAHALIDAGACLVLGHHPHVPQETERYGRGVIVYSLGNCVFDEQSHSGSSGELFQCVLSGGVVQSYTGTPLYISNSRPSHP